MDWTDNKTMRDALTRLEELERSVARCMAHASGEAPLKPAAKPVFGCAVVLVKPGHNHEPGPLDCP